jgi:cation transport regulator ChaB
VLGDAERFVREGLEVREVPVLVQDSGELGHLVGEPPSLQAGQRSLDPAAPSAFEDSLERGRVLLLHVREELVRDLAVGLGEERFGPGRQAVQMTWPPRAFAHGAVRHEAGRSEPPEMLADAAHGDAQRAGEGIDVRLSPLLERDQQLSPGGRQAGQRGVETLVLGRGSGPGHGPMLAAGGSFAQEMLGEAVFALLALTSPRHSRRRERAWNARMAGGEQTGQEREEREREREEIAMPTRKEDLPDTVKRSSAKAQRTYAKALDSAHEEYGSEERAHRTAFAALKHSFEKVGDRWEPKRRKGPSDPQAKQSGRAARDRPKKTAGGVDVEGSTKRGLLDRARKLDISGRSRMSKYELGRAIATRQRSRSRKST